MFKIFPATIHDSRKIPIIKGWQRQATDDPEQIKLWQDLYRDRVKLWGVPTGPTNNIFVLDVDVKPGKPNGFQTLKDNNLYLPNTTSQQTLSGGRHYIYKYPNGGHVYGNKVGFMPGLDIRGEGGWIAYYGIDATPMADAPQWLIDQALKPVQQSTGASIQVAPDIAQGIVNKALENIREAPEGESNNVLNIEAYNLGQLIASNSITRQYAEEALFRAAMERGKPVYEARATIESGLKGGGNKPMTSPFGDTAPVVAFDIPPPPGPPERWTPHYFTRGDLMNTSNLRKPQLFANWSTEDIHITTADGGTGKTTLKLYEAICLALGDRFLGFECKQRGKTLFITGEDTEKKLAAMLGAIVRQMGLFENVPGYNEKIETIMSSIVVKKDADMCLIVKDRMGFISYNSEAMRKVLEAVDDIKPKMIVFDPISSFWGSESQLNDMNKAVTKFMSELVERSGACVEMINHMGKASSNNKDLSQFAGRGGSGLPSNSRVSRALRPIFEDEYLELTNEVLGDKQSAMMCNVNKFSDGSPIYNKPFLILRDGFLFKYKSLTDVKIREQEKKLGDVERVFAFIKEERQRDRYPTKQAIQARFMTIDDKMSEARSKRALDMIQYAGHMGEYIKLIENPDPEVRDRAYIIIHEGGKEI